MFHRLIFSVSVLAATAVLAAGAADAQVVSPGSSPVAPSAEQVQVQAQRDRELELERGRLEEDVARQRELEQRLVQQRAQEREMTAYRAELEAMRAQLEVARRQLEETARNVATQRLVETNYLRVPTRAAEATLGLAVTDSPRGVLVTRVAPGSGAAAAGVQAGDVVRSVNGVELADVTEPSAEFASRVRATNPGDRIPVVVDRAGRELALDIRVQRNADFSGPTLLLTHELGDAASPAPVVVRADNPQSVLWTFGLASRLWSDMELVALTPDLGRYFSTSEGLLVIRSPSDDALDLVDGDVILSISGRPPSSPEHAMRILASFEPGETIELAIMRQGTPRTVTYDLPPSEQDRRR